VRALCFGAGDTRLALPLGFLFFRDEHSCDVPTVVVTPQYCLARKKERTFAFSNPTSQRARALPPSFAAGKRAVGAKDKRKPRRILSFTPPLPTAC
jgi:hypothetical protein